MSIGTLTLCGKQGRDPRSFDHLVLKAIRSEQIRVLLAEARGVAQIAGRSLRGRPLSPGGLTGARARVQPGHEDTGGGRGRPARRSGTS